MTGRHHLRTEAQWRNRALYDWYGDAGDRGTKQAWGDKRWHQLVEVASAAGWPDLYWAKPDQGAGWVEFKLVRATSRYAGERVDLGLHPSQPLVLRWMAAQGQHAGILAFVEARDQWLWVPAQSAHRWAENVQGPNGFLFWPHTWGIGEVPRPWLLPVAARSMPWPMAKRNPHITYMVDGAQTTVQAFDARSTYPMDYRTTRQADAVLEKAVSNVRRSVTNKATKARQRAADASA